MSPPIANAEPDLAPATTAPRHELAREDVRSNQVGGPLDWRLALTAALLAGLVPLIACPTANIGFNDDWSYAHMAFCVAETGTYRYDGWATALVGPQAYWGAIFVKLFGATHFVLRCSVLTLAAATAAILYFLARRAGLRRGLAFQATAACMLSPLMIPYSCSFMTDVPGLFFGLASIALAGRAVRAGGDRAATGWFAAMLVTALAGGAVRQVVWAMLVSVAPAMAILSRRPARVRLLWLALTAASVGAMVAAVVASRRAPYAVTDDVVENLVAAVRHPLGTGDAALGVLVTMAALVAPSLVGLRALARRVPPLGWIGIGLLTTFLIFGVPHEWPAFCPWMGTTLLPAGILSSGAVPEAGGADLLGARPLLIPTWASEPAAVASWFLLAACLSGLAAGLACSFRRFRPTATVRWLTTGVPGMLILFGVATVGLATFRFVAQTAVDRYLLYGLPGAVVAIAMLRQRAGAAGPSRATWAAIAAGVVLGLALTFEYHSTLRAREVAVARLVAAGVDPSHISAGLEVDGERQLRLVGHINDPRLRTRDAGYVPHDTNGAWTAAVFWFAPRTPAVRPEYVIARGPAKGYIDAGLGTVTFASWIPPFRRELYILRVVPELRSTPHLIPHESVQAD